MSAMRVIRIIGLLNLFFLASGNERRPYPKIFRMWPSLVLKQLPVVSLWSIWDSNPRPPQCHCGALPAALMPRKCLNANDYNTKNRVWEYPFLKNLLTVSKAEPTTCWRRNASPFGGVSVGEGGEIPSPACFQNWILRGSAVKEEKVAVASLR